MDNICCYGLELKFIVVDKWYALILMILVTLILKFKLGCKVKG
jgi:hypothetical protein